MRNTRSRTLNAFAVVALLTLGVGNFLNTDVFAQDSVSIMGPKNASDQYSGSVYGPITSDDTLWRIAERYRQNKNLSVYQVMAAIYELNPDAFEQQNLNLMINGAMLKLPSERFVARFDASDARLRAERDEQDWARASQLPGATIRNIKPPSPPVNQEDLNSTKDAIEQKLQTLDETQARQFDALRDQFAQSISSVESLLEDNRKLYDRLDQVDADIDALRNQVEGDVQGKMDAQTASIEEMLALLKAEQAQREAEQSASIVETLTSPLALTIISSLFTLSLLGGLATWLLRKKPEPAPVQATETLKPLAEPVDTPDVPTGDDLLGEPEDDINNIDDDELFNDDDLLDDVLSSELEDSLDDELENFADLSDEMLVPETDEDAAPTDDLFEEGESELGQDDLDSLFDQDDAETTDADGFDISGEDEELIEELAQESDAELADDLLDADELEDMAETAAEDIDDILDEVAADMEAPSPEPETESDEDEADSAAEDDSPQELDAEDAVAEDPISQDSIDDLVAGVENEDEESEISIDELLDEAAEDQGIAEKLGVENDNLDEDMLEKIDDEIKQQNQQLDNITDNLINEIEQLEMMGGMLDGDEDIEDEIETAATNADGIQDLDALAEDLDDIQVDDMANADEFAEPLPDDLMEELQQSDTEPDIDSEDALADELLNELEAEQSDDADTIADELLDELETDTVTNADAMADELLDELEAEQSDDADTIADELLDELETDTATNADAMADELLDELEAEQSDDADTISDGLLDELETDTATNADAMADELLDELEADQSDDADTISDELLDELETDTATNADAMADELLDELEAEQSDDADTIADELLDELETDTATNADAIADELVDELEVDRAPSSEEETDELLDDLDDELVADESLDDLADEYDLDAQDNAETNTDFDDLADALVDDAAAEVDVETVDVEQGDIAESEPAASDDNDIEPHIEDIDAFSEALLNDLDSIDDFQLEQEQDGVAPSKPAREPQELADVPGLDDWLSDGGKSADTSILDELENADFDDLLSSIDDEEKPNEGPEETPTLDNPDLDLAALFSEEADDSQPEDDYLSVDDLLEEAQVADGKFEEEDFDLDVSLADFTGDTPDEDLIDVDIDSGQAANLDLARAYIDMDDEPSARGLLLEVMEQGTDEQKHEAQSLLKEIGDA